MDFSDTPMDFKALAEARALLTPEHQAWLFAASPTGWDFADFLSDCTKSDSVNCSIEPPSRMPSAVDKLVTVSEDEAPADPEWKTRRIAKLRRKVRVQHHLELDEVRSLRIPPTSTSTAERD